MFGENTVVGAKFFANQDKLLVTSIFVTLQGEGPYSGMPAVFIRLAKCQLQCNFCDTYFEEGTWLTIQSIFDSEIPNALKETIEKSSIKPNKFHLPLLVITGGEPTLQPLITDLIRKAQKYFGLIQIETNGLIFRNLLGASVVCSPKCVNNRYLKPLPKVLKDVLCLKFVLSSDPSSPYHTIPKWAFEWARKTGRLIFASPMNVYLKKPSKFSQSTDLKVRSEEERISFWEEGLLDRKANELNHYYAAQYCLMNGVRLTLQTHLYANLA